MCKGTYDYYRRHKRSVYEEVARLREARRLSLKQATILVEEVWVHQDSELRLRYEERREDAP